MLKNLQIYRIAKMPDVATITDGLERAAFVPCSPTQALSIGWVPPRGIEHGALLEMADRDMLLKLQMEMRIVPAEVVKRRVDEMAAAEEEQTGRKPGKKALKEMKEFATHELMPSAFTRRVSIMVWICTAAQLLMIDTPSTARADEVVSLLVKSIDGLMLHLLQTQTGPAQAMAEWLNDGAAPTGFTIDRDCELKSADEMKSVVKYTRHTLDLDEVRSHLEHGKVPTKLALTWNDRVSFVLTDLLQLRKLEFLDLAFEGRDKPAKDEAFDADAAISTIELGRLLPDLIEALDGYFDFTAPTSKP